jgi:transmembrane sensor
VSPRRPYPPGLSGDGPPLATHEVLEEAAVWITRLNGPDRSPQRDREFQAWQARSPAHRLAYERVSAVWGAVPQVTVSQAYAARRPRWVASLAVAAGLALCAVALQLWRTHGVYSTDLGDQRVVTLDDGSRVSLNTQSRVRVDMNSRQRTLAVEQGEALFEVAKDAQRPFVVQAAGSEVVAHGTVFAVRLIADRADGEELDVTLIEGKVTVQAVAENRVEALAPASPYALEPGERMRLAKAPGADARVTQRVDRPRIEGVTAWRRNEVVFDNTPLLDAVAEMNRYDRTPVVVVGEGPAAGLRVSGSFRTGDTASFARAVAVLHGLVVHERDGRLEISNPP